MSPRALREASPRPTKRRMTFKDTRAAIARALDRKAAMLGDDAEPDDDDFDDDDTDDDFDDEDEDIDDDGDDEDGAEAFT